MLIKTQLPTLKRLSIMSNFIVFAPVMDKNSGVIPDMSFMPMSVHYTFEIIYRNVWNEAKTHSIFAMSKARKDSTNSTKARQHREQKITDKQLKTF